VSDSTQKGQRRKRRRLKTVTERLLQDGFTVDEPTLDEREELRRLSEDVGIIEVSWEKYFLCTDHKDDNDLVFARNRACEQKIEIQRLKSGSDALQFEDDREYECPWCGRTHWPRRRKRTLYDRAVVSMPINRVLEFFKCCIDGICEQNEQLEDLPTYRLKIDGKEVYCCLLHECLGSCYATREFIMTSRTVYVVMAHRVYSDRFPDDARFQPLPLHELVRHGSTALKDLMIERVGQEYPFVPKDVSTTAYLPLRRPEPRVVRQQVGRRVLVIHEKTATLDGVEVVSSRARGQLLVLRVLVDQWRSDIAKGKPSSDHTRLSAIKILHRLRKAGNENTGNAETVHRAGRRLQTDVSKRFLEEAGVQLQENEFIEYLEGFGFRLNAEKVTIGA